MLRVHMFCAQPSYRAVLPPGSMTIGPVAFIPPVHRRYVPVSRRSGGVCCKWAKAAPPAPAADEADAAGGTHLSQHTVELPPPQQLQSQHQDEDSASVAALAAPVYAEHGQQAHGRPLQAASGASASTHGDTHPSQPQHARTPGRMHLHSGSSVEEVLSVACATMARARAPPAGLQEHALAALLRANLYEVASDLAEFGKKEAVAMGFPMRLHTCLMQLVTQVLEAQEDAQGEEGGEGPIHGAGHPDTNTGVKADVANPHEAVGGAEACVQEVKVWVFGAAEELAPDIALRLCPPLRRFGHHAYKAAKLTGRTRGPPYALKANEMSAALEAELRDFTRFYTVGVLGAQGDPVRPVTCAKYVANIRAGLGWLHRVEGLPCESLRLHHLVPSHERQGAERVHALLHWLRNERGLARSSEGEVVLSMLALAKFLYHAHSRVDPGDKSYSDIDVVKQLRGMYMSCEKAGKVASRVVDDARKWLTWEQYLGMVTELRKECAGLDSKGRPRDPAEVAMSLQAYLMAAILSCIPDRQRTLRELEVGRTLVRDPATGTWAIRHSHADYKTGKTYGERAPLVLPPHLYPELEAYLTTWRAALNPSHNFVFSKRCGKPLDVQELSRSFSITAYRMTGQKTNPHLIRDMIVTHARDGKASDHELEALAAFMGHSVAEQRSTYDRRTKAQRVGPAAGLLLKLNGGGARAGDTPAAAGTRTV